MQDEPAPTLALVADDGQIAVIADAPHDTPNGQWLPIVDTPKPPDTDTDTYVYTLQLVAGVPTVVWVQQPLSVEEQTARRRAANDTVLRERIRQALDGDAAAITASTTGLIATFTALPDDLTGSTVAQALTAIGQNRQAIDWLIGRNLAHERQLAALIRLVVAADLLDTTDDTETP